MNTQRDRERESFFLSCLSYKKPLVVWIQRLKMYLTVTSVCLLTGLIIYPPHCSALSLCQVPDWYQALNRPHDLRSIQVCMRVCLCVHTLGHRHVIPIKISVHVMSRKTACSRFALLTACGCCPPWLLLAHSLPDF